MLLGLSSPALVYAFRSFIQLIKEKVFLTNACVCLVFGYARGSQESEAVDSLGAGTVSSCGPPDVGSGNWIQILFQDCMQP